MDQIAAAVGASRRFQFVALAYVAVSVFAIGHAFGWLRSGGLWLQTAAVAVVALAAAAAWESARYPRLCAHGSAAEAVRTLLQLTGDVLLIPLYATFGEAPMLGYQSTPQNLDILAHCPSLMRFKQTPWLRNTYLSFVALMYGDFVSGPSARKRVRRETIQAPDGGVVALDWWEQAGHETVEEAKGVLFIGSTFTGDALVAVTRSACEHFVEEGWRVVVMVKRGCGLTMPNTPTAASTEGKQPAPWCLSGLGDLTLSIDHVARTCPDLPVVGLGFSTGAAQMRHYVNTLGKDSKLAAAVLVDAGTEWGSGMDSIDKRVPAISQALAGAAATTFKAAGHPVLPVAEDIKGKVLSGGIMEFACNTMAPAHGYERSVAGGWAYTQSCSPAHASRCAVPVLEMLTMQDTVMDAEQVLRVHSTFQASPNVMTAMTQEGTHMVRWEGWRPRCWVCKASAEFLEAALRVLRDGVEYEAPSVLAGFAPSRRQGIFGCAVQRPRMRFRTNSI